MPRSRREILPVVRTGRGMLSRRKTVVMACALTVKRKSDRPVSHMCPVVLFFTRVGMTFSRIFVGVMTGGIRFGQEQ